VSEAAELRPTIGAAPGSSGRLRAGPLLAFAELRARLLWRRLRGGSGVPELVARAMLWLIAVPLGITFAGATGLAAWRGVRAGGGLEVGLAATTLFFGVWTAWTAMALTVTERDAVDLRRFLVYPIAPWRLTAYGLSASVLGDPFAFFWCLMLGGAFVGAAVARPGAWLLLLAVAHLLFVVTAVSLVAALQEMMARLLRGRGARQAGIAAVYAAAIGLLAYGSSAGHSFWEVLRLFRFLRWVMYPPALAGEAVRLLYLGRPAAALPWLLGMAAAALATAWVAHRLALAGALSGEQGAPAASATGTGGWHLPGRLGGLLEKEGKYLLRNPVAGLVALLVPAVAALVAWKVAPHIPEEAGEVVRILPLLGVAMYAHLVTEVFYLNAFGWERGGGRLWFLAPVPTAQILWVKNAVAYGFSLTVFAASAVASVAVGGAPPGWGLGAAFALHAGVAPWLAGAGNFVSILNPRPIPFEIQRGGSLSPASALSGIVLLTGVSALFGLPALAAVRLESPGLLVAGWAALGVAGLVAYRVALPRAARLLERRREALLDAVAGDEL
jgi:ABC-2 type transport system permease protein